jgi:hypothetical protein
MSWEAHSHSVKPIFEEALPCHTSPPLNPHLSRMNSAHTLVSCFFKIHFHGRVIAQAVSRRLPTAATRLCGTGAGFLRVLRFPLPIIIPPIAPHSSSSIIRGWYNRPNSARRTKWTHSHPTPRNVKKINILLLRLRLSSGLSLSDIPIKFCMCIFYLGQGSPFPPPLPRLENPINIS